MSPSSSGRGKDGILFRRRAAFPLTSRTPNRWNRCLMASSSSLPVLLAWALASFLSWSTAFLCQPPNVSTGRGMKLIPSLSIYNCLDWRTEPKKKELALTTILRENKALDFKRAKHPDIPRTCYFLMKASLQ